MYSLRCARSHVSPLERPVRRRVSVYIICDGWVAPFGYLRVEGCSHLSAAYRSVPRPSSPVYAKASTNCPYLTLENPHHQRQIWNSVVVGVPGTFTRPCKPRAPPVAALRRPTHRSDTSMGTLGSHSQLDNLLQTTHAPASRSA